MSFSLSGCIFIPLRLNSFTMKQMTSVIRIQTKQQPTDTRYDHLSIVVLLIMPRHCSAPLFNSAISATPTLAYTKKN